jgi:predicted solute-binding protein
MRSKEELIELIKSDPHLSSDEKYEIISKLNNNELYKQIIAGGASMAVLSKFTKLSTTSKVLLTLAGFGISKYLLDTVRKHDKFFKYNYFHDNKY